MNMDRDDFLEVLERQYRDVIREAMIECEHNNIIQVNEFAKKLKELNRVAQIEGFPSSEFWGIVEELCPELYPELVS